MSFSIKKKKRKNWYDSPALILVLHPSVHRQYQRDSWNRNGMNTWTKTRNKVDREALYQETRQLLMKYTVRLCPAHRTAKFIHFRISYFCVWEVRAQSRLILIYEFTHSSRFWSHSPALLEFFWLQCSIPPT